MNHSHNRRMKVSKQNPLYPRYSPEFAGCSYCQSICCLSFRVWRFRVENDERSPITGCASLCQLHVHVGESVNSLINKGGDGVQVLGVEFSQNLAEVSAGEASSREGHWSCVCGAELEVEGGDESVDEGSLEAQRPGDDGEQQGKDLGEQRCDQLGQDDGGEHHHEDGKEVSQLAEVQPVLLCGGVPSLVESVVVGGAGCGVPCWGGGLGVGGVISSVGDPVLGLATITRHLEDQAHAGSENELRHREGHLDKKVAVRRVLFFFL